jgi:hypothetical protein
MFIRAVFALMASALILIYNQKCHCKFLKSLQRFASRPDLPIMLKNIRKCRSTQPLKGQSREILNSVFDIYVDRLRLNFLEASSILDQRKFFSRG